MVKELLGKSKVPTQLDEVDILTQLFLQKVNEATTIHDVPMQWACFLKFFRHQGKKEINPQENIRCLEIKKELASRGRSKAELRLGHKKFEITTEDTTLNSIFCSRLGQLSRLFATIRARHVHVGEAFICSLMLGQTGLQLQVPHHFISNPSHCDDSSLGPSNNS